MYRHFVLPLLLFLWIFPGLLWAQFERAPVQVGPLDQPQEKVGVVLSGGGASGLAHIGVLKALEENNIPIDYICGTSIGALIGCMYSIGYTPLEIEMMVLSDDFKSWATGTFQPDQIYYFKRKEDNASWITFKLSLDTTLVTNLPTNLVSPVQMDFALMEITAAASAAANYNFDSLFIPFRCVASDIASKQSVIFRDGDLGESIRASMSYPFYVKPIRVNGKLLFDGGLYNNFPSNVMYDDFFPDFIIGSNVATAFPNPDEDNLLSQIRAMLTSRSDFDPKCENGIVIEPDVDWIALFDFENARVAIDSGYNATLRVMGDIKLCVNRRSNVSALSARRSIFKAKQPRIVFDKIEIDGPGMKKNQVTYVSRMLRHRSRYVDIENLRPGYYRLASDDKIKSIFPKARYNTSTGYYDLKLTIKKEKKISTQFGGNFSNRPINMGFVGFQYNMLRNPSVSLIGNIYFGKLYSSLQARTRIDFPTRLPFYIEPVITLNRWDYYRSSPAFFEDTKPPFLIKQDRYAEVNSGIPIRNKGRLLLGTGFGFIRNLYYQTDAFTSADTADRTDFSMLTTHVSYERNTLNRKQFATSGTYFSLRGRYVHGEEFYEPGTTAGVNDPFRAIHNWFQFCLTYDTYYKERGRWRLGFSGELVFSTQPFFSNYTASILSAPAFEPTPESRTYFIPQFRAYKFAATGLKSIFVLWKAIDWRVEGYVFVPYEAIRKDESTLKAYAGAPFTLSDVSYIAMTALVWHSPLGPVSVSLNYYSPKNPPFSLLFNFGYIIFNRKSTD
ncbi:MAG TPA: patatin-like phospholipase family protein [Bacteroidia bacterium]|nr:patatin-like phospholipase family protein [Bacteroidia bacterium]